MNENPPINQSMFKINEGIPFIVQDDEFIHLSVVKLFRKPNEKM